MELVHQGVRGAVGVCHVFGTVLGTLFLRNKELKTFVRLLGVFKTIELYEKLNESEESIYSTVTAADTEEAPDTDSKRLTSTSLVGEISE